MIIERIAANLIFVVSCRYKRTSPAIAGLMLGMAGGEPDPGEGDTAVAPSEPETRVPPQYHVIMHNDDYTPMEFVVEVLTKFFNMDREQATQVMLTVHTRGRAVAGTYSAQIAETKVAMVNDHARAHQHPLLCTMEEA